jgi:very-short-patch-repair endonuclease
MYYSCPVDIIQMRRSGKITASQIWDADNARIKALEGQGYEVLIIWEHDFKENKDREIQKCISFLTA